MEAHSDLGDAVNNYNQGDIVGYGKLEDKEMEEYLVLILGEVDNLRRGATK